MNFIAAVLQLHMAREEDAFWCLDVMLRDRVPGGLSRQLTSFKVSVLVLCDLAKTLLPDSYLDLEGLGMPVEEVLGMICPQWFISLFVNALPRELVLRFWDIIFLEGSVAVFQLALALLEAFSHHLHESRQALPTLAPDYVAQLIAFSRRAPEVSALACVRARPQLSILMPACQRARCRRWTAAAATLMSGERASAGRSARHPCTTRSACADADRRQDPRSVATQRSARA